MHTELRQMWYDGFGTSRGEIIYALGNDDGGRWCVYSGLTKCCTSTINAAEAIITALVRRERIDPDACAFYDLQTYMQYGGEGTYARRLGYFVFDLVSFNYDGSKISNPSWDMHPCSEEIFEIFREYIGEPQPVEYFATEESPQAQAPIAEQELASGQFKVFTPREAFQLGYCPVGVQGLKPSQVHAKNEDCMKRYVGCDYVIVDNKDHPALLRQVPSGSCVGKRFAGWCKKK